MNRIQVYFAAFSIIFLMMMVTSCSPTSGSRTSKYSSANKRSSNRHHSKEDKKYTYEKNTKTTNRSGNTSYGTASTLRNGIVLSALQYEGTQYASGGKTPESGFDCSGFTGYIFTQNGIPLQGPSHKLAEMGVAKTQEALQPGDLVFFGDETRISHVAIVSDHTQDQLRVVHATTSAGVKVDEISKSEYWKSRFLFGRDLISNK